MTRDARPLVALISATPVAIGPAADGFARQFPEAQLWNILDDRLLAEANDRGSVDGRLADRMKRLIGHAVAEDARAVLLTCSLYGFIARDFSAGVPVLAPDDAAFAATLALAPRRVVLLASLESAGADGAERLLQYVAQQDAKLDVDIVVADGAYRAAAAGDHDALATSLAAACVGPVAGADAVVLAQYSLATVAARLEATLCVPVVAGPDTAARALRTELLGSDAA